MMKEKPIIFSTLMVQAILAGKKTMTRRIIKRKEKWIHDNHDPGKIWIPFTDKGLVCIKCPCGFPGDRLWVRETWTWEGDTSWQDIDPLGTFWYKADIIDGCGPSKWKPSIHMPRIACRLFLEVEEIRVERLQEISEEDAKAEGCPSTAKLTEDGTDYTGYYPSEHFQKLWESIHGPNSWNENPWVWVISFKVIEK